MSRDTGNPTASEAGNEPRGRVLVVDDDPVIRDVCVRLLEAGGFHVDEVENGEAAIRHLSHATDRKALVLLDMTMPGMNGADVVEEMQRLELSNPVIIATGYSDDELKNRLPEGRIRGFLRKPFSFRQLIECVEGAIRQPGA